MLQRRMARRREEAELEPVTDAGRCWPCRPRLEDVTVEDSIGRYIVALTAATRDHPHVLVGASPRGSLALMLLARARAALAGRDYVIPEDVKAVAEARARAPDDAATRGLAAPHRSGLGRSTTCSTRRRRRPAARCRPTRAAERTAATVDHAVADPYRYTAPPRS